MNPYSAYRRPDQSTGSTRIDLLLALYDKALLRLDQAEEALKASDLAAATPLIAKAQLAVSTLAGGVRPGGPTDLGVNILRLYEFVVRELQYVRIDKIQSARRVLLNLRQGFEAIRSEANALERSGRIPSGDRLHVIHATA